MYSVSKNRKHLHYSEHYEYEIYNYIFLVLSLHFSKIDHLFESLFVLLISFNRLIYAKSSRDSFRRPPHGRENEI